MTVCVAAIANDPASPVIVACTDKRVTAGDMTYDMTGSKRINLTQSIVALTAGDPSDSVQICRIAQARIASDGVPTSVATAAQYVAEAYREYRRESFERELLEPFGLTYDSFMQRQNLLDPDFVSRVDRHTREAILPLSGREFGCSIIVAGTDTVSGPIPDWITAHIYIVSDPGQVTCQDMIGFAAIGSGARQAESFLMLERYGPSKVFDEATLAVYSAKRQAELDPFVGADTELIRVDTTGMGFASPDDLVGIEKIYKRRLDAQVRSAKQSKNEMAAFMEGLNAKSIPPSPQEPRLEAPEVPD